jgi:hypothetical protein
MVGVCTFILNLCEIIIPICCRGKMLFAAGYVSSSLYLLETATFLSQILESSWE